MKEELLKGLTEEQIAKIKTCKNTDEMLALAKQEGVELTDEQLEAVSGGACAGFDRCPRCNSDQVDTYEWDKYENYEYKGKWTNKKCHSCGYTWDFQPD